MVAPQVCKATMGMGFGGGQPKGHDGISGRVSVTIMNGKRTVVGVCQFCHQPIIAQEPEYNTVLAPLRQHQLVLARGLWMCEETGIDHMGARQSTGKGTFRFVCIDCDKTLVHYLWTDNLTGEQYDVFLYEFLIEEEPV